jgi:hypothetical protein
MITECQKNNNRRWYLAHREEQLLIDSYRALIIKAPKPLVHLGTLA